MKTLQIVASNCVDVDTDEDGKIFYPQLKDVSAQQRRMVYWRCVMVFFASSVKFNTQTQHILYTNDESEVKDGVWDFKKRLQDMGVEIRIHHFQHFKPPRGYSNTFKNAFYKLDIIQKLGEQKGVDCILLDTDCIWVKSADAFTNLFSADNTILLYDPYTSENPAKRPTHLTKDNMLKSDVWKVYQSIDENYPELEPRVFGGELIGGSSENLQKVAEWLAKSFAGILQKYTHESQLPKFPNNKNIFSGMEYWSSLVYNQMPIPYKNATGHIRRIWTAYRVNEVLQKDFDLTIWHMPAEKDKGIYLLSKEVLNPNSRFWKIQVKDFPQYAARFVGLSGGFFNPKRFPFWWEKATAELKKRIFGK